MRRQSRGFTLIELMVVLGIIAILAAIAYPSYLNYIQRANRRAAESVMMDLANKQQLYLASQRQYADGATAVGDLGVSVPADVSRAYTVTIVANNAATPPSFAITGTPIGQQLSDGVLLLDTGNPTCAQGCRNNDPTQW